MSSSRPPASGIRSITQPAVSIARPRLVERYRRFLPVTDATPPLTLGEGFTPLVHARRLGSALGLANLYLKVEGQNPTGSFKDRGMVVAVAKAAEDGARAIVCASTGNTSASAAAYGAAAGLDVIVILPKGHIAIGKLLQALIAGARVVAIDGNFDQALGIVRALAEQDDHPVTVVNSINPFRLEGQKTGAFEICDDLGRAPDVLAIPVGNAGNISACWAGFCDYAEARILAAYRALARYEGVFCEPASAASVAGITKASAAGELDPDETVVCVLTGHGLKDPTTAERQVPPFLEAQPTVGAVSVALGW